MKSPRRPHRLPITAILLAAACTCLLPWCINRTSRAQLFPTPSLIQSVSGGAGGVSEPSPPPPRWPTRPRSPVALAIHAQPLQKPALQFALLPGPEETAAGNAALRYLAATDALPVFKPDDGLLISAARSDASLADLAKATDVQQLVHQCTPALRMLREGSRLDGMDMGINVRQGINWTLPSLSKFNQIANILTIAIRLDIQKHDWAAACDKLQTGYALARHQGEEPTLIEALVGVAIGAQMNRCLEDWVAEPGSPNLYWPLTNLPAPLVNERRSIAFEVAMPYFQFPELEKMKHGQFSPDLWQGIFDHLRQIDEEFGVDAPVALATPAQTQLLGAFAGVAYYGPAKQFLMDRGLSKQDVEKMPVTEVLERYLSRSYEEDSEEFLKWSGLPDAQAAAGFKAADHDLQNRAETPLGANPIVKIFMPSFSRGFIVAARTDRQIAMLRTVEAIRAYAAEKGTLPEKLDDLTVPVPKDSLRDAPFIYSVKNGVASLEAPSDQKSDVIHYDITLQK